jgi:hypothetical protein
MAFGSTVNKQTSSTPVVEPAKGSGKGPVEKIKYGGITLDIWENEGPNNSKFYTFTIQRSYKQGNDWKNTTSLRQQDLPKVILALQKAYEQSMSSEQDEQ